MTAVNLVETFWSVQGEGTEVGRPSAFVRFGECDLRCAWCDSVETWRPAARYRVERSPGSGDFEERDNPVPIEDVVADVLRLRAAPEELVSITGGEPLLQPEGAAALAAALRQEGSRVLLETHGVAVDAIAAVAPEGRRGVHGLEARERRAARGGVAPGGRGPTSMMPTSASWRSRGRSSPPRGRVLVKIVVSPASTDDELREASRRIAAVAPDVPLVLQPVTPCGAVEEAPGAARMLSVVRLCAEVLPDVRMIPQTHKLVGVL